MTKFSSAEIWQRYDAIESRLAAPLSERMLDLAGLQPGMRVLDLATGRGEPAIRAAHRVGPQGHVVGIDLDDALLQMARDKAEREGLENLELRVGDAALLSELPSAYFHATTCRWGLMYMSAPVDALANARRASLPDAVLVAALWAEPERVSYYTLPRQVLQRYRSLPPIDFAAPGIFRYASVDTIARDFARAGWSVDHIEEMDVPVFETDSAEEIVAWARAFGLDELLQELAPHEQRAWEHEFAAEMERAGKPMRLGGITRIVRARAAAP